MFSKRTYRRRCLRCLFALGGIVILAAAGATGLAGKERIPVIYCTDLFHPHEDPDDHLDLMTVFSMPELDIRALLLDQGAKQKPRPGSLPVEQMLTLTGRRIPYGVGLVDPLKSPEDPGIEQPKEYQQAVELLIKVLQQAPQPLKLVATGSVRDIVAAFNRDPDLLRKKLSKVYVNIGRAALDGAEWNVHIDPLAYKRFLQSGLQIIWYPCLPLKSEQSAHWILPRYGDILEAGPLPLQNFFLYALHRVTTNEIDPRAALHMNLRPWRRVIYGHEKAMWSTASIIMAAERKIYRVGKEWHAAASPPPGGQEADIYTLARARMEVDDKGKTTKLEYNAPDSNVWAFKNADPKLYGEAMIGCLKNLFKDFPLAKSMKEVAGSGESRGVDKD